MTHPEVNHHHPVTPEHCWLDPGDGKPFVANRQAAPLLRALHAVGLRTRTHHLDDEGGFVGILLGAGVRLEVRAVSEPHSTRDDFDGRYELLLSWTRASREAAPTTPDGR